MVNTGHRHPLVMKRVYEQLRTASPIPASPSCPTRPSSSCAEKLNALAPDLGREEDRLRHDGRGGGRKRDQDRARAIPGAPMSSPSTAASTAARFSTMALTGKVMPYKTKFGPFPAAIWHVPFPVEHKGISVEDSIARHRMAVQVRRRAVARGRDHHRAGAGRRRLLCGAQGIAWCACASSATSMASC